MTDANNTPRRSRIAPAPAAEPPRFLQAGMLGAAGLSLPEVLTVPEKGKE